MEFLFITPSNDVNIFESYLKPSLGKIKAKCAQISDKDGSSDIKSVSDKYNTGVDVVKEQGLMSDDLVFVFVKEDVHILDGQILEKLDYLFSEYPDTGVVGVVGVKELVNYKSFHDFDNKPVNGIIHKPINNTSDTGIHVEFTKNGYFENIIGVDDAIFAIKATSFDDDFKFTSKLDKGFGIDISLKAIKSGLNVVVADILVISSTLNNIPFDDIDKVVKSNNISDYPISVKNFNIINNNVVEVEL